LNDDLEKDALWRLAEAKKRKSDVELDIREAYFFLAPRRCRDIGSSSRPTSSPPKDQGELQTSLGMEVAEDFVTEVLEGFMPESVEWCDQMPTVAISEDDWADLQEQVSEQTSLIHRGMKQSNFYTEMATGYNADLPIGTVGMWIDRDGIGPIVTRAVPIREMEINVGPDGKVDDRFIVRHTTIKQLPGLLPKDVRPKDFERKLRVDGNKACKITWGFWRKWEETGVVYQGVLMVDEELLKSWIYNGEGSCPFIVSRFNPDSVYPFGDGPSIRALPELRKLDEMEALETEGWEFQVRKPMGYHDDGVINFANGIEAGMFYPMRLGPGMAPVPLTVDTNLQLSEYAKQAVRTAIKRLHYVDYPEQRGKTPPTAAQWLDEMAMRQRRLGRPGKVFWGEGPQEYFMRFRYLMAAAKEIEDIKVEGKPLPLAPYNPTEKAKDHADVLTAERLLQMSMQYFPQVSQVQIDAEATMNNIKSLMRDKVVVIRTAKELQGAISQLAPVIGSAAGGDIQGAADMVSQGLAQ